MNFIFTSKFFTKKISFWRFFSLFWLFLPSQILKIMSQRVQSLLFFLTAVAVGLLLFAPLAEFSSQFDIWELDIYGVKSSLPNSDVPFGNLYLLPVLILTILALLLAFYVTTSLFRAVKIKQFSRLLTIARISTVVIVAWIATVFAYYVPAISRAMGEMLPGNPVYKWGIFMPLAALLFNIAASFGLKSDLVKIRSANRIR